MNINCQSISIYGYFVASLSAKFSRAEINTVLYIYSVFVYHVALNPHPPREVRRSWERSWPSSSTTKLLPSWHGSRKQRKRVVVRRNLMRMRNLRWVSRDSPPITWLTTCHVTHYLSRDSPPVTWHLCHVISIWFYEKYMTRFVLSLNVFSRV